MTRLRDRVDVIVEAGQRGVAAGGMVWDVSEWDDPASDWSGVEPTFVALDGWEVISVSTRRGRQAGNRRHPAGTAEIVLGWRSPVRKWSFRPTSPVQVGMEMRVSCRARSISGEAISAVIPIFRGAVRDLRDGWTPDRLDPAKQRFRLTCQLTDRFADLAAVNLPEQALIGLGDTTAGRITRILELAGIDPFYLAPSVAAVEHSSSNFARNLLDEAQVTAESETGDLYVDRAGYVVVRDRLGTAVAHAREDAVQLTWSNDPAADGIPSQTDFGTGQNLDDVVNRVSLARAGGAAYQAPAAIDEPTDQQLRYGLRTYQRFDMTCRYDADVEYAADYWLAQLQDRTQRVDQLQARVNPNMPDARLVELLDIELRDRHQVRWTDGEVYLQGDLHVQGVSHRITGAEWSVSVSLWAYAEDGLVQLGRGWGEARWGIDAWGS